MARLVGDQPAEVAAEPAVLQGLLPVERSRVWPDALAGVTLAALGIPEVLGYAKIAGMPLVTGLYTMLLPMAVFAVLGSSRHLVVAADSATAAILAAALAGLAVPGSARYVRLAGLAALLTAVLLLLARLTRLSFLANFLSRTVLVGFLAGVGIQVAIGQLPDMLGVTVHGSRRCPYWWTRVRAVPASHGVDVAVSAGVIVIVLGTRVVTRRIPGAADRRRARDRRQPGPRPGQPRRGHRRERSRAACRPSGCPPSTGGRHRAARCLGGHVRGHPGAERGDRAGLRREVRRAAQRPRRPERARRGQRRRPRSPARSWSTAAPPRRRWWTARAAAASWPSSPPPPWSWSPPRCSPGRSPTCRRPPWPRWSS